MPAQGKTQEQLNGMIHRHYIGWQVGTGAQTEFPLPRTVLNVNDVLVFVAGALKRPYSPGVAHDYRIRGLSDPTTYPGDSNYIKFAVAPALNADIGFFSAGG